MYTREGLSPQGVLTAWVSMRRISKSQRCSLFERLLSLSFCRNRHVLLVPRQRRAKFDSPYCYLEESTMACKLSQTIRRDCKAIEVYRFREGAYTISLHALKGWTHGHCGGQPWLCHQAKIMPGNAIGSNQKQRMRFLSRWMCSRSQDIRY